MSWNRYRLLVFIAASLTSLALSMESGSVLDAEIDELARGLRYDPGLMYRFVHDHIEFYPMWGEVKSAAMTLLDRSGDAFDQASLMIALLTKAAEAPGAPHTITDIKYVVGDIELNAGQVTNWLGIPDSSAVVSDLLAATGMSGQPVSNPDGTIAYVRMTHVWVKATIDGQVYEFDPSCKSHIIEAGLTDSELEAAMGYAQSAFLTSAQQGCSSGSDWVKDLNKTNIIDALTAYSTNLIDYIEANHPAGNLADLIGGKTIVPAQDSALPPPLPYVKLSTSAQYPMGGLHYSYRTRLRIQFPGINEYCYTSDIYGRRLIITFKPHPTDERYVQPYLWLDGTLIKVGNGVTPGGDRDLKFNVYHVGRAQEQKTCRIKAGGMWSIVNGWGHVGTRIIELHRRILQQNRHDGYADDSNDVLGESFTLSGLTWAAEVCRTQSLVSQISDCTVINHHQVGVMGQYEAPYIDMPMGGMSLASHAGSNEAKRAAFLAIGGQGSAYEHGVIHQLQDYGAVSTVKLMDIANDRSTYDKIFEVTSANWSGIASQLQQSGHGYSAAEIADVNALVTAGYTIYLPEYGDLQEEDWKGVGYLAAQLTGDSWAAVYGISGGYNGGYVTATDASWSGFNTQRLAFRAYDVTTLQHARSLDPIDLVTGACTFDHADIVMGDGGFPFGLRLGRQYNSIQRLEGGPLGLGWTHGFDITTEVTSSSFQAMGEDSPIDAAANIAALYVTCDLFRNPSLVHNVVASLSEKWLMDQMIDNVVVVKQGHEAMQFVKLPDGSFNPPPGKALKLITEADGTYLLKDSAGNLLDFDSNNRAVQWSDPHGNVVDYAYSNDKLSSVTSRIGGSVASRSLTFTYDVNHIDTVTDSAGRTISFDYDSVGNLIRYTDPEGYATTFEYDAANDGQMTRLFYPNHPTQPYATNVYDPLGRVIQQTNANGHTYDYFYSYYRTEELEPTQTPPGGPATRYSKVYYFDDHGKTVAAQDQLGRTTATQYDGQQRPARVVSPAGASVEYAYDLNHNVVETRSKPVEGSALPDIVQNATYATHEAAGRWFNRLTSQTDAAGNTTSYEYDFSDPGYGTEYGVLRKVTLPQVTDYRGQPVTATQQFTYNAYGQPETTTDPNGIVTRFEYYPPAEGAGLKKTIVDYGTDPENLNLATELTYDSIGDVNSVTDAQGHVSQSEYTPSRRLQTTVAPSPFAYETHYEYFPDGQVKRVRQQMGSDDWQTTDYTYTPSGEVETIHGPVGSVYADRIGTNAGLPHGAERASGQAGDGLSFDGQASSLDVGLDASLSDIEQNFTIAFWVSPGATHQIDAPSAGGVAGTSGQHYVVGPEQGDLRWPDPDSDAGVGISVGTNGVSVYEHANDYLPAVLVWQGNLSGFNHVAIVYIDNKPKLYINGAFIKDTDVPGTTRNVHALPADIGGHINDWGGNYGYFAGTLDELCIFDKALSPSVIQQIYQNGSTGQSALSGLSPIDYPISYWDFDKAPYNKTTYAYDALDRPWTVTDAENNVTETRYWPDGQVWKAIDAEGHDAITNAYNADGTLYSVQDAKGNPTVYDYDDFTRPFRTWYADNTYEQITYDNYGRAYETRTRAGQTAQFAYDALNRTVSKTVAGNTTAYGYDIGGRTVNTSDNAGTLHHSFDRLGRLDTAVQTNGATVSYLYDELSQCTRLTYPDGNSVTYSYDSLGRLTDVNDFGGTNLAHYAYDDLSRRVSAAYANGTSAAYTYSNSDRLAQLSNTGLSQPATYSYAYDLVGNRTSMLVNGTQSHLYTYDHIYQLTDVNYPEGHFQTDTGFTYDPAGNRSAVDNPPTTYTANNLNQYTFVGSEAFDYDDNGNLTSDGHHGYTYDAENRLLTATVAGQSVQYTYDAAGRRIRRQVGGQVTQYVYDGDEVIAEYDGAGTLLRRFIYGPGLDEPICLHTRDQVGDLTGDARVDLDDLLALAGQWLLTDADPEFDPLYDLTQDGKIDNADADALSAHWRKLTGAGPVQVFYYHFDGLGSVVALSDAAGDVVATYAYDVYGRSQPAGTTHGNPYRFTARRWDGETGLYHYRARYYHPAIGRFLQPDPIGYADGLNWYTYCGNSPIILVDPWGLGSRMAGGGYTYRSAFSSVSGLMSGYGGDVLRHTPQALLNGVQAVQDFGIGIADAFWYDDTGPSPTGIGIAFGAQGHLSSPQWARGLIDKQSTLGYEAEKIIWTAGLAKAVSARGSGAKATGAARAARVHGNSLDYVGDTHVYGIKGPKGTHKIGQSMQGVRVRDGASIRGEAQTRALTRQTGDLYRSEIQRTFPNKAAAREYETRLIERYRRMYGDDTLPGNKTNR